MNASNIVDTDTHVTEAADLWTSRLPSSWRDERRLHVEVDPETDDEVWAIGDRRLGPAWIACNWGWGQPYPSYPPTLTDCHPATYDAKHRAAAMDDCGIQTALLYPNVGGARLTRMGFDAETANAHTSAYNDFQIEEWVTVAPGRFIPMLVVPFWDVPGAVAEIERLAGMGFGGIVMTGSPQLHGEPALGDQHWDPMWSAADAAALSVSFHVGGGLQMAKPNKHGMPATAADYAWTTTAALLDNGHRVADLLLSGVLARHPTLKFVSVESGIGWIPFVLESCDYHFKKAEVWKENPDFGDLLPSDLFRRQVYANYWFERLEPWHIESVGADHILFETDFPHPTCLYGSEITDALHNGLDEMSEDVQHKILRGNAAALYGLGGARG
jgi:predicted TIM-barrel fold metal-dependent hydrolase